MDMNALSTVLQAAPGGLQQGMQGVQQQALGTMGDSFIFGAITAVSVLLVAVGVFYVLMKLGRLLDAMKDKM
jgi:multidrug efflux pump subunit AcrB